MKLERIKLAGFKSFVDPTVVHFPSNLVCIVGPNGCGKSNLIDAVRWVMGESSARLLRGESMADVIFNGSANRPPVSLASIELIFDNSDGRAGGEYAAFQQIAVKRQVGRDGQSVYFLNGTRCRRRDIQDLFLGTGLGPRSYAIIEQGMIARLIEARPDELRLFLEEAAGISKYKERRRETEERIRHTRENLERLDDLRWELDKQLARLERQAELAARYTQWRAEEVRLDLALKALRWRALEHERQELQRRLVQDESALAAIQSEIQSLDAEISVRRSEHRAAAERCHALQGQLYGIEAEIARAEQSLRFAGEERRRYEAELARLEQELAQSKQQIACDNERLGELAQALAEAGPALECAEAALVETLASLVTWEADLKRCESEWEAYNRAAAKPLDEANAERIRLAALEQTLEQARVGLKRIEAEWAQLADSGLSDALEDLSKQSAALEIEVVALSAERTAVHASRERCEAELRALDESLDQVRTQIREHKGRLASLRALQESALAEYGQPDQSWLKARGLDRAPRLIESLEVESGWEEAVESCLGAALTGVLVEDLDEVLEGAEDLPPGLMLCERVGREVETPYPGDGLGHCVRAPWPAGMVIGAVRTVEHWRAALAARRDLEANARWVTPEGIEVGCCWIRVPARAERGGMIARAEAIAVLESALATLLEQESGLLHAQQTQLAARADSEQRRRTLEAAIAAREREQARLQAELRAVQMHLDHQTKRRQTLVDERARLEAQMASTQSALAEARTRLADRLHQVERVREQLGSLEEQRARLRMRLAEGRAVERTQRDQVQALRIRIESKRAAQASLQESQAQLIGRQAQFMIRCAELRADLDAGESPLAEQRAHLETQRARRHEIEQMLIAAHQERDRLEAEVRRHEGLRQQLEQQMQSSQRALEALRLEHQERLVRQHALEEQLAAADAHPQKILQTLDRQVTETEINERLSKVRGRLQRLGPVNLAAVDEFKEQAARKAYLDTQYEDIVRALHTLEQAIRAIDRETRQRFKETFERVNQSFQSLFPRLFGGGQATLELADANLLETGMMVMARPPGKRNTSIHLLSGGEKALTAVALVFAIFELNPAPFCMLDEVDAPLDDVNVGRFCELVRSMSDRVQLILVSHNKQTMEIAQHLIGVTMHEPGVSRLVSVDVEEALRLAGQSG
ncbi:chromosome segregation protein SMC [Caldichromatium japonicum]|uniref:Chromosome partition protein Smc n=1 Tax=Caldichromatium japonicum TaxID=2699430 RepID=A0A6G7VDP4_9GAMM|nr:chromosome segregation protein SMC [Caldichromatium japonicum]QIK37996.1 chromosome segregation protein SMC [Caldichromatium japonicum]